MNRGLGLSLTMSILAACSDPAQTSPDSGGADASAADARPSDAAPADASAPGDGALLACDLAPHDPVLGTARLGAAFRVLDSAVLPVTSWLPVAAVDEVAPGGGLGLAVYGYEATGKVHRLGHWPKLDAPSAANEVFDAVAPEDRALQVLITPTLATTQGRLLAGYRTLRAGSFVHGGVGLFDPSRPGSGATRRAAPGIESALGLGSYFLVGGDGLGDASGARGVYAVSTDGGAPTLAARYPIVPGDTVRPGPMAITAGGVVVLGYYLDVRDRYSLRLPEPAPLAEALSGGAPVDLAAAPELTTADDVEGLASFGHAVAVLHTRKVVGILPALGRLDRYPVTRANGGTVIGPPETILSAEDEGCTAVSQLVPVSGGMSLIVGVWDRNGQRLVRLAPR